MIRTICRHPVAAHSADHDTAGDGLVESTSTALASVADGDRNAELSNANKSFADRRVTAD
jgi:hypothetical protein